MGLIKSRKFKKRWVNELPIFWKGIKDTVDRLRDKAVSQKFFFVRHTPMRFRKTIHWNVEVIVAKSCKNAIENFRRDNPGREPHAVKSCGALDWNTDESLLSSSQSNT